jgi:uncharacterized protein
MSEIINIREHQTLNKAERKAILKQIFQDLQNGKNVDEVKAHFDAFIGNISIDEISQLQHDEMDAGGISVSEMKRIYSAHTEIFKGAIEEINQAQRPEDQPGHPDHTFKLENKEIDKLLRFKLQVNLEQFGKEDTAVTVNLLIEDCNLLFDIDKHYSRKENLIFPYLEKYGIFGPTNNMWRIDDFIRDAIKDARHKLANYDGEKQSVIERKHSISDGYEESNRR